MKTIILGLVSCLSLTLCLQFDFTQSPQGTRLRGSSFGVLGHNATFDYVVGVS